MSWRLATAALFLWASSLQSEVLDLERVVSLALEGNPSLKAVEEQRREVEAGIVEARAEAFPQLAFNTTWNRSRSPALLNSPDFEDIIEFLPGGFEPSEQELWGLSIDLSQPLFTFGKVGAAIELARLVAGATDAQIGASRLATGLSAAEAYFELLAARQSLEVIEIQRQSRKESLEVVQARYELGEATRLELLQSRAALAELEPVVDSATGGVAVKELELSRILGRVGEGKPELAAAAAEVPAAPPREEALAIAFLRRPELVDLTLQRQALAKQKQVTLADGLPQIELDGVYGHTSRLPENLDSDLYQDWRLGVAMRWELFDGGRRRGQAAQIESRRDQLVWNLRDLQNRIRVEVERAWTELETARSRLEAAEVSAAAAREASRMARESYEEGVALQADWLDAQQREIQSEVVKVQAYYETRMQAARLSRAMGLLPGADWSQAGEAVQEESR